MAFPFVPLGEAPTQIRPLGVVARRVSKAIITESKCGSHKDAERILSWRRVKKRCSELSKWEMFTESTQQKINYRFSEVICWK